ncbi:MAG: methyltransferase domain-containing protein [bacterium]
MKSKIAFVIASIAAIALIMSCSSSQPPRVSAGSPDDAKAVQGNWKPAKAELAGQPMNGAILKSISLKLEQGRYEVSVGGAPDKGTYTLDSTSNPKGMTITGTAGPNSGKTFPDYEEAPEVERLRTGPFQLEFERTKELLAERLPQPPATILDVGGGPGAYALWLAELGYEVHLIDPVHRLVAQAQGLSDVLAHRIESCSVGDARELKWDDRSVDIILELGPLYHLIHQKDRLQALRESFRVLRPGGKVFVAAISRFASALDGLCRDLLADQTFQSIVKADLEDGIHRNETGRLEYFTTAKFHRPDELKAEVVEAGFTEVDVLGIEGPGWILPDFEDRWRDPRRRLDLLAIARRLEREPSIQGVSAHLLAVGEKPV